MADLPYEYSGTRALVYNDEIHILGGGPNTYTDHKKYNASNDTWESVSTLPYEFFNAIALVYNDEIHIMGGNDTSYYTNH